jgi:hypothetical protein
MKVTGDDATSHGIHDPDGNEWKAFVVLRDNLP